MCCACGVCQDDTVDYTVDQLERAPKGISVAVLINFADLSHTEPSPMDLALTETRVKAAARCALSDVLRLYLFLCAGLLGWLLLVLCDNGRKHILW